MSQSRGLLPVVLATTIGIGTGLYIFGPAFKEEKERKEQEHRVDFQEQHPQSPEEQVRKTEEAVANAEGSTRIPTDTPRWSEVQADQFSKPANTFSWHQVSLDQRTPPNKSS
ncbi:hypothetical protein JMJ35_003803 [Cladonia borealis]|uniref:Uncharacterized protein n=1 Tax=Cladonia borealis TaxID=184061 RepID=A0AA39R4U6_9LECA|nr:hypothetical protein JMJ35_003803 [Cladonia borealis]